MISSKLKYLILLVLLSCSSAVWSQMILDTLNLMEFEVLGSRTLHRETFNKTKIDSISKKEYDHLSLDDLLSAGAPVFIKNYGRGAASSISLRGSGASHTQVLWNGFNINSPMMGQSDLSQIPNFFFDEVSIAYGGGALAHTPGAIGGSVSINSGPSDKKLPVLQVEQLVGSFSTLSTHLSVNLGNEVFQSSSRFLYLDSENDFSYYNDAILPASEMKRENAQYGRYGFSQQFSYQPNNKHELVLTSWNQWNERNIPQIMTNVDKSGSHDEYQNDFSSRTVLSWKYHKKNNLVSIKSAYFIEKQHYFLSTADKDISAPIPIFDTDNTSKSILVKSFYQRTLPKLWVLSAGLDLSQYIVQSESYAEDKQRKQLDFNLKVRKQFLNRIIFESVVRSQWVDQRPLTFMPYLGLNYRVLSGKELFLKFSMAYNQKLPSLNDLYWVPSGNENLKTEKALLIDGGMSFETMLGSHLKLNLEASAYYSDIDDWIQWAPSSFGFFTPQNLQSVVARGLEIQSGFNTRINQLKIEGVLQYAYTRTTDESAQAQQDGYAGRQLIYIPVHTMNAFVYVDYYGFSLRWHLDIVGKRTTSYNDSESLNNSLPTHHIHKVSLGKGIHLQKLDLALKFRVNNVFDQDYQVLALRPMPGRNYEIILSLAIH